MDQTEQIVGALAKLSDREGFADALRRQLVVVEDDLFRDLCRHATPVNAHIRLESESKTTKRGALWYEETLPPETLLSVTLSAGSARRRKKNEDGTDAGPMDLDAATVLQKVANLFQHKPYLQLGGNETVGMGWCRVTATLPVPRQEV